MLVVDIDPYIVVVIIISFSLTQMCEMHSIPVNTVKTPKLIKTIFGLVWFMLVVDIDPYIVVVIIISFSLTQMCEMHSIPVNTVKTCV